MGLAVAVVVSGRGSNLAALLRALGNDAPAQVVLVLSNRADSGGLNLARDHGIPTHLLTDAADPAEWLGILKEHGVDLVVLAGFLRRVPGAVVEAYRGRMINIHPALLPRHGGSGMFGAKVHAAVLAAGDLETGATVHLATTTASPCPTRKSPPTTAPPSSRPAS